ncbi:Synaptic vesicle glycoprotein 2B [Eumeta japonica]|uniref:Synaptic vesicle glycoprotein 2B n=1 Tax=Eumeta variegata TaxID=151549 RepID=A0A4C1UQY7_EUMVA|nr:Synaptic vesicle glycoprotein 2B [Eumeta japonica]
MRAECKKAMKETQAKHLRNMADAGNHDPWESFTTKLQDESGQKVSFAVMTLQSSCSASPFKAESLGRIMRCLRYTRSGIDDITTRITCVGRYNYVLFVFSIYSVMSAVSEIFGVGIVTTAAQCDLDLDMYKKGLIGSLPMLGVMISGHLWGYIADTRGRKFTLYITIGGTFLTAVVSSFANHWIFLAFTKFVSAMFASGTNAVMYTLLGESTPQSHRARFLLYAATGVSFSQAVMARA